MAENEVRIEFALPSPKKHFTPAVTVILILLIAGWTLLHYAEQFTINNLALSLNGIMHGKIWQFLTYPFFDACAWNLIFDAMLILFIGSTIEHEWRTGSFVLFWLVVSVFCGMIWITISAITRTNYIGAGSASCAYGLIAIFGLLYRKRKFIVLVWVVEAQYIAWALVIIGIVLGIPLPITWIWVSGALVGYLYLKLRWYIASSGQNNLPNRYKPGSFVDID